MATELFKRFVPLRGRVTVRFGKVKEETESSTGIAFTPLKGSVIVAPTKYKNNISDEMRDEDSKRYEGIVVLLGEPPRDSHGNAVLPDYAEGDRVVCKRGWGDLLVETEAEELRVFNQGEVSVKVLPDA